MLLPKKRPLWILLVTLLLVLTACNQPAPNPNPNPTQITAGCTVQSLIDALDAANQDPDHTEIILNSCVYTLGKAHNAQQVIGETIHNGLPVISTEITIRGNNSVIEIYRDQGEPFFGHFQIEQTGNLQLYDLKLTRGVRPTGGAVFNNGGGFLASNVVFEYNSAIPSSEDSVARGGAVYSRAGMLRIINGSHFQGNQAGESMAAGANLGGAIYAVDSGLNLINSSFLENFAVGDGGAIYSHKTQGNEHGGLISISNGEFNSNFAFRNGGTLAFINEIEGVFIASTWFRESEADELGGAVFAEDSDLTVDYSEYRLNQSRHGGAVYTRRTAAGRTSIYNSQSTEYVDNTASGIAGALFSENSDIELDETEFLTNQAGSCGGIRLGGTPDVDVAAGDLETAAQISSEIEIQSSTLHANQALNGAGGGICHLMGELALQDTTLSENQASSYGGGLITLDNLDATGSTFWGNLAYRGAGLAVGFPLDGSNNISPSYLDFFSYLRQSSLSDNQAQDQGGGLWAHHGGTLLITRSTVGGNLAAAEGGGIYQQEGNLYIDNSTLAENTGSRGGGLYAEGDLNTNPVLRLLNTTVAYNTATDTGSDLRSGGGGLNINGITYMRNSLIILNANNDCDLNQELAGNYGDCGETYCPQVVSADSDDSCAVSSTFPSPGVDSFNGSYVPILNGSPLIDDTDCMLATDQIGTSRPQGSGCEFGAIEYASSAAPAPPPPPPATEEPSDDTAGICDPFAGLEISVVLLNVNPETLSLPVYLRFPNPVPGIKEGEMPYRAELGGTESTLCNQQGFEDRLYCMFTLPPGAPGSTLDLEIYQDGCKDPVFTQPQLTVPDLIQTDPDPECRKDLNKQACEAAGGQMSTGQTTAPHCICP